MLLNYLKPWMKSRSEEVYSEYDEQNKDINLKFLKNIELIRGKSNNEEVTILLLELEEIFNQQQELLASEIYNKAFEDALKLATSIYK
ncbi:hypothetical protein [Paenibacillus humicus]|uniref:hypothetical protein n=1 Tax=Paenibacillus humicus TaxID=412861 RepID=UPI003D2927EB